MRILKDIRSIIENYHVKSGLYHFYRGEYKQSIEFLDRALSSADRLTETDAGMARYYLTQAHISAAEEADADGRLTRAVEELTAAAEANLRYPDIQFRLARALEQVGRLPEAIARYRLSCEINPQYLEARTALGFALIAAGQTEEAAVEFQEVFKQAVAGIARPFREGLRELAEKNPGATSRFFRDAFFAEPYRLTKLYRSALEHLRAEAWQEATEALREAILLNPNYADLQNYLGIALAESGQHEEAIRSFRESIRLNPRYSIARLNLAYALSGPDDAKEAVEVLEKLLEEDPTNTPARTRLDEIRGARVDLRRLEMRRGSRGPGR